MSICDAHYHTLWRSIRCSCDSFGKGSIVFITERTLNNFLGWKNRQRNEKWKAFSLIINIFHKKSLKKSSENAESSKNEQIRCIRVEQKIFSFEIFMIFSLLFSLIQIDYDSMRRRIGQNSAWSKKRSNFFLYFILFLFFAKLVSLNN